MAGIAEFLETVLLIEVVNILFPVIVMGSTFLWLFNPIRCANQGYMENIDYSLPEVWIVALREYVRRE